MPSREESFAQMCERLKQEKVPDTRPVDTIAERRYFLIVSEGAKTEPIYFQYFKDRLPRHMMETIEIEPGGRETIRVVELAMRKRVERRKTQKPPYDEIWAVFDKDDFPDADFNDAISMAQNNGIEHAASNQAFELWYVLHYQFLDVAIRREQYFDRLSAILGFPYQKNTSAVVTHLFEHGNFRQAIQWEKMLEQLHAGNTPADSCPSTRVYVLVERLAEYLGIG